MRSPEGQDYPEPGVFLEVVENERLVVTDAYVSAWVPSEKPFMTLNSPSRTKPGAPAIPRPPATGPPRTAPSTRAMGFDDRLGEMRRASSRPSRAPCKATAHIEVCAAPPGHACPGGKLL